MKKITIEIEFDDKDCYKGKGENIPEMIKDLLDFEMYHALESDFIIKNGWKTKIIKNEKD